MHRLLIRQLQRHLDKDFAPDGEWQAFLGAVSSYYREVDQEKVLLENALAVNSQELTEINEHLRAQNTERTRTMLNTLSEGVYATDVDGQVIFMNASAESILGWKERELTGKRMHDVICHSCPDGSPYPVEECPLLKVLESGDFAQGEEHVIRRDGNFIQVSFRANPLLQDGQIAGALVSFLDITERKLAEKALFRESYKNEMLLRTANDGLHILSAAGNIVQVSDSFCHMLGYTREEMLGVNVLRWDARLTSIEEFQMGLERLPKSGAVFETLQRRKDGSVIDVEISASSITIGGEVFVYCSARDVTERKRMEHEMRLASMVYQHTGEGMLVTDADNSIVAINPACMKITGYSLEEIIGKNPRIFSSGRHDRNFYLAMWQALNTSGFWHGEIWDRRRNGEVYAKWMTINRLLADDGSVHGYVALFSDITEKKQSEELIWRQANFDTLTRLPNRRMFRDRLEQEIKSEHRAGLSLALLFIDLDHFKEINDTLGHHVGDELLVEAARRISACTRESDTVARLGGDEFTVILTQLPNSEHVEVIAQEIITRLAEPFLLGEEVAYISASIGITLYPDDALNVEQLLKNADQAMYVAKNLGRNRFSYFTYALQEAAQSRLRVINDLHGALASNQFRVYFQPIVELASGHIHKAEALLRWQHPTRGMVGPVEFISLAEETGLIIDIGDWVFREAARWTARWDGLSPAGFQVSVNKSPVQFRVEGNIHEQAWLDHLDSIGLSGNSIVVEITEGLLLNADTQVADKLLKLRDAGIQVAIDDFGTGYSSLAYLKKFDIDYLKIDISFVRNLATDPSDRALCEAIIVMAHKLGLKVIAEGVETEVQKNLLEAAGCDYVQGYLFSRPIPPEEFEQLLKRGFPES